jgi:HK97 family phage portal protein
MAWKWYDRVAYRMKHRGSSAITELEGKTQETTWFKNYFTSAYDNIETVRRGTDLLVDSSAEVNISIKGRLKNTVPRTKEKNTDGTTGKKPLHIRQNALITLIQFSPNPFEDINVYRRQVYMDLVLTGNAFEYFDGVNLYHLPAELVQVVGGKNEKIEKYVYNSDMTFQTHEIIHTRDNSGISTTVGTTRLKSCKDSLKILYKMLSFQDNFFQNGAVPGLILTTPNALGTRIKDRLIRQWQRDYEPAKNGRRPMILDADLKPHPMSSANFKELDFENSISKIEGRILKALGIPTVLIDGGNNANIRPNLQLFYETTVVPLTVKHISAYEAFFGYDLEPDLVNVRALRPELRDLSAFLLGLVNSGIITINEAREELRLAKSTEEHADELRIPQNITGSATNPTEGGRPEDEDKPASEEEEDPKKPEDKK